MKNTIILIITLAIQVLLTGCSKEPADTKAGHPAAARVASPDAANTSPVSTSFAELSRFKGMPPADLLKDPEIGKVIRSVVPQSQFKCLGEAMEWMPDLDLASDGSIGVTQTGSHAEGFRQSFLSITPKGSFDLVLLCQHLGVGIPKGKYQYFTTSSDLTAPMPKSVQEWLYQVGDSSDILIISNGKEVREVPFDTFVAELSAGAAAPFEQQAAAPSPRLPSTDAKAVQGENTQSLPAGTVVQTKVGGVMCGDFYSMNAFIETSKLGECLVAKVSRTTRVLNTPTNTPGWVFVYVTDSTAGLIRSSDLIVVQSAPPVATQGTSQRGWFIAEGATICIELKAIHRARVVQQLGHIAGLPDECILAPRAMSVRVIGNSAMPGISVIQVGTEQFFVQNGDLIYR